MFLKRFGTSLSDRGSWERHTQTAARQHGQAKRNRTAQGRAQGRAGAHGLGARGAGSCRRKRRARIRAR
eukprot:4963039-Prymnesium_polylepis.1